MTDCILIEDTREQNGYSFAFATPCIRDGLNIGDYSVVGLQDHIAVERKSLEDLIGSFTSGRKRFEAEFRRARPLNFFAVVIEARISDLLLGNYRSSATPQSVFESMNSWSVKFGRPFLFCECREIAARTTESLLLKYVRQFTQAADDIRRATKRSAYCLNSQQP